MMVRETERGSFIIDRRVQAKPATEVVMLTVDAEDSPRLLFLHAREWQAFTRRARHTLCGFAGVAVYGRGSVTLADGLDTLGDLIEATETADLPNWLTNELATLQAAGSSAGPAEDPELYYIRDAGLYTRADALHIAARRTTDVPYAQSAIEAVAAHHVRVEALYAVEPLTGGEP